MQELKHLIDISLDQELSADQLKRLDGLIVHDPEARRYYLEQIALVNLLQRRQSLDGSFHVVPTASESLNVSRRSVLGFSRWLAYSVASIAILGVAALLTASWIQSRRIGEAPILTLESRNVSEGETIATVVASDNQSIQAGFSRGDRLKAGQFQIGSGAISLVLRNGVTLDMEGPLDFDMKSPNLLELKNGTVRARVPETESQFVIKAPDLEVQDLGTEFGLSVRDHRATELHVFDGAVELRGRNGEHEIIREGTALSWNHGVRLVKEKTEESSFATPDAIGFRNWQAYFETIRRDPASIVCFDFHNLENSNRVMNQAMGNPGRADAIAGEVHGPIEVSGRWVPKESLLFEKGASRVEFDVPGTFDAYTLSTWICLTRLADSQQAIFTTHSADPGELHLQIERDGAVRMGVQRVFGVSSSQGTLSVGKWHHIVAVVNRKQGFARCYVDGEAVIQEHFATEIPFVFGKSQIGAWAMVNARSELEYRRFLRGRIDEFVLLQRAMTATEIRQIYELGKADFAPVTW